MYRRYSQQMDFRAVCSKQNRKSIIMPCITIQPYRNAVIGISVVFKQRLELVMLHLRSSCQLNCGFSTAGVGILHNTTCRSWFAASQTSR